ncbi:hypothetical protein FGRMN_3958 [Fusarium graminum]|nr:hypothetical protein FGRMN_3958 [Fusarium graminum]
MASNVPQIGSVVDVSARLSASTASAHSAAGAQTHDQGIASLEAEMAKHKASPNVSADLTDLLSIGSHFK